MGSPTLHAGDAPESVKLLDGGEEAYPRMLLAIGAAQRSVHLQVYAFSPSGVGSRFLEALSSAAGRGVSVWVSIDGWGTLRNGRAVQATLNRAGCTVRIHNPLWSLLTGHFGRNHRKLLLIDDEVAFIGGINIGDENLDGHGILGWADLALEIRGPQCVRLGHMMRREPSRPVRSSLHVHLCGVGGGWRLRRRYIAAFVGAVHRIDLAHGYFLPDQGVVRAITSAAGRGVQVHLLLAGRTDIPFTRAATRSLHRQLLAAGVHIHEWNESVLHAKIATVDGHHMLVGSFNLDPFSLANQEALVEVHDMRVVERGESWIRERLAHSPAVTAPQTHGGTRRWVLDRFGLVVARAIHTLGALIGSGKRPAQAQGAR